MGIELDPRLDAWIDHAWRDNGSDLLFHADRAVRQVVYGDLSEIDGELISEQFLLEMCEKVMNEAQYATFKARGGSDFAFSWRDEARVRANLFLQQSHPALALRILPRKIPTMEELQLPAEVRKLATAKQGFVLFSGSTGAGKSTSMASLGQEIASTRPVHIITIEDPIEYIIESDVALVSQREIGTDVESFKEAMKSCLRQRPDVIFLGEMRDTESIETALSIAETGHLVFSTVHTNDAASALDRILDAVPSSDFNQVRAAMAAALTAVVAQRLVPRKGGGRPVAIFEVLIATDAVRNLIRRGQMSALHSQLDLGESQGMVSLNLSLAKAVAEGLVEEEIAMSLTKDETGLKGKISRFKRAS